MENIVFKYKMLGVVTLYNPDIQDVAVNIRKYIAYIDCLIIWDNSPLAAGVKQQIHHILKDMWHKVVWHGTGENLYIAPAINYSLHYALDHNFDLMLIMDQDSSWNDFLAYRIDVESALSKVNSGMIIPIRILSELGEVDEKAFPLDALDHDISYMVREHGYLIVCLTRHILSHSLGQIQRMGFFHIMTPNYNWQRTYSMTRSHIICYRKHKKVLTDEDRQYLYREILIRKFVRIILAEPDKFQRMKAFIKGIFDGLTYKE